MDSMVERVARAIRERELGKGCPVWEEDFAVARAAIEAMREPTPEMIENGVLAYNLTGIANGIVNTAEDHVAFIFSAMLPDAALKGEAE